jgi:hypothetical protein
MTRSAVEDLATRMRPARGARDPQVTPQFDLVKSRPTISHQYATVLRQNFVRAVAMPADGEVEHIQWNVDASISPHPRFDTRSILLVGRTEDFMNPLRSRIRGIDLGNHW